MDRDTLIVLARMTIFARDNPTTYWDALVECCDPHKRNNFAFWKELHECVKVVTGEFGPWTRDSNNLHKTLQSVIDFYKERDLFA